MNAARVIIICFLLICIFVAGLFFGSLFRKPAPPSPPQIASTATVLKQVQTLSELVTVKYVLEKVVILEDPTRVYSVEVPGGGDTVWMLASGVVKAGLDMKKLTDSNFKVSDKKIVVTLPSPVVFDVYLDDNRTQVLERSTGIFRRPKKELEQDARRQALGQINKAARELGIYKDAEDRARVQLTALFQNLGFTNIEFRAGNAAAEK
jgi:hypothetical protein